MTCDSKAFRGGDAAGEGHGKDWREAVVLFHAVAEKREGCFEVGDGVGRFIRLKGREVAYNLAGALVQ